MNADEIAPGLRVRDHWNACEVLNLEVETGGLEVGAQEAVTEVPGVATEKTVIEEVVNNEVGFNIQDPVIAI